MEARLWSALILTAAAGCGGTGNDVRIALNDVPDVAFGLTLDSMCASKNDVLPLVNGDCKPLDKGADSIVFERVFKPEDDQAPITCQFDLQVTEGCEGDPLTLLQANFRARAFEDDEPMTI